MKIFTSIAPLIGSHMAVCLASIILESTAVTCQAPTETASAGLAPLTVCFSNYLEPSGLECSWDFGDGSISSEQNPTHTYTNAGAYLVIYRASVVDESGVVVNLIDSYSTVVVFNV